MALVSRDVAWRDYVHPPLGVGMHEILVRPQVGLELDGHRVSASIFDQYALHIVEWCIKTRSSAMIGHPDPLNVLTALVPAAAHVSRLATARRADARVAVVTRDHRIRSVYRRLSIGGASLSAVVPAVVASADGAVSRLGNTVVKGATYFVRSCNDLRFVPRPDLVVVDAPAVEMGMLPDVPCIYLVRDPADYEIVGLAQRLPTFCWNFDDVAAVGDLVAYEGFEMRQAVDRLRSMQRGLSVHVDPVIAPNTAENAALFWLDVGSLIDASRGSRIGRQLAQDAFALYQELLALSVPFEAYEQTYGSVERRIKAIDDAADFVRGECRDLYVPTIALDLEHMANSIRPDPPKRKALLRLLEPLCAAGDTTVLTRDTASARITADYLSEHGRFGDRVQVVPFGAIPMSPVTRSAVLLGMPPSWARHVYFSGLASEVHVLAYTAGNVETHGGPCEAEIVRRTVAKRTEYSNWLARPAAKAACWSRVSDTKVPFHDDSPSPPRVEVPAGEPQTIAPTPDIPPTLWDRFADTRDFEETPAEGTGAQRGAPEGDRTVEVTKLTFSDERWVLVGRDADVSLLRTSSRSVELVPISHVTVGDIVVAIDDQTRKDVLTKVIEVGADVPELAVSAAWMHPWKTALSIARRKFRTYNDLHRELARLGCTVQAQTVRLWTVGATIGPEDPENVRRMGIVAGEQRLIDNYRRVYAAIEKFRGAHSVLFRRIGDMARIYGTAAVAGRVDADEVLDQRSGLTVGDLRDCIDLLRITAIEQRGAVPRALLDRIQSDDQPEEER